MMSLAVCICMQVACLVLATYKILLPYIKNHEASCDY